jgi:hypothetical protein
LLIEEIKKIAGEKGAAFLEKKDACCFEIVLAERKAFLTFRKLVYKVSCKIDPAKHELRFSEMLFEKGWGLSGGDSDRAPGFGFKTETYKCVPGQMPERVIEERSILFGKKYEYKFDLSEIRSKIREAATREGFGFRYCLF